MRRFIAVLLCAAIAVVPLAAAESVAVDSDEDGAADQWLVLDNGQVLEQRSDRNGDGKIDHTIRYGNRGQADYEEYDFNYDGSMDDFYFYLGGVLVRQEVDSNFDGRVDIWVYLTQGIYIERYERDTDHDGTKDRVVSYGRK